MQEGNTHISLHELIADLKATNWIKDNPQLLDESAIARWVYLELKGFGRGVQEQYEEMVHVDNYRAALPANFSNLNLALYCDVDFVQYPQGTDPIRVQNRLIAERIITPEIEVCDLCSPIEDKNRCTDRIVENFYVEPTLKTNIYYKNFHYVTLGKDLLKTSCSPDCHNRKVLDSPYSINIKGTTLYANFQKGSLYIRYYGMPMDDDGLPLIPVTQNGKLEKYLEYHIKCRILEDAMLSKDSTNQQNIFSLLLQKEQDYYNQAKADVSKIDMAALFRAVGNNRRRMERFKVTLGAQQSNYSENINRFPRTSWSPNNF